VQASSRASAPEVPVATVFLNAEKMKFLDSRDSVVVAVVVEK
jgi:hypothetical protein